MDIVLSGVKTYPWLVYNQLAEGPGVPRGKTKKKFFLKILKTK